MGVFLDKYKIKKEEEPFGWKQRTKGIGTLPGDEEEKEEFSFLNKYKFTADVGLGVVAKAGVSLTKPVEMPPLIEGLPISKPEDRPAGVLSKIGKGFIGVFGTWEAKKRAMPELQKMEDFASIVISEAVPLAQSRYGEEYSKRGSYKEEIAIIHEYLTGVPKSETLKKMDANFKEYGTINPDVDERTWLEYYKQEGLWKTLITGPTKGVYDEAEKLQRQLSDIRMRVAEPGKDFIGQVGWTGVAIIMGYQGITALYKGGMVIENRIIKGEKLKRAVERIQTAYIPKTGKFKASLSNNDFRIAQALNQIVKRYGKDPLTGLTEMEVPQQVFMGQVGKITNIVKIIQSAGKLTPEVSSQLKALSPELVSQVIQNLSVASPAIASKLAPELVKLIPKEEVLKKVIEPKVKEEIPKVGVKELIAPKEPTIPKLTEKEIVPATIKEAKEILKVDPKKPSVPKVKLAEEMVKKKVSITDIEAVKGEKIDVKKPRDIIVAIRDIKKAVKKEVVVEPTPKAIPKEPIVSKKEVAPELKRVIEIKEETEKAQKKLIGERVLELKEEGFKGVEKGGLKRDEEGKVIGRYPAVSKNPKWYRDFYAEHKKSPNLTDLKEIAEEQLLRGHEEDYGIVPPNEIYQKIDSQIESYDTIIDTLKTIPKEPIKPKKVEEPIVKEEIPKVEVKPIPRPYELKKELTTEQKIEGNKLIGHIQATVHSKGLTKVESTALKRKYGLSPHLATDTRRMTMPQLQAVLKAVERARPKIVGHRKVVTLKTENKIQSLKTNLIDKLQMTEETYQGVLKDVGVYKEPKYIDAKQFITEKQGKDVIYRLIDESNILRVTMPFDRAVTEDKVIKSGVNRLDTRIKSEGIRRARDPHELSSMRVYVQNMETTTGTPIYTLYQDLINSHLENKQKLSQFIKGFNAYEEIIKDEKELKKVNDYIFAKSNLKDRPPVPENMTDKEIKLAKKIEGILKDYEAKARTEKFLDNIDHPEDIPQYLEFKKEIDKAKDIYESKGYDDLVEYMKTQKWGVIKSGYSPLQVISPRIRLYKPKAQTFGKTHIKTRTDIEYHEQDRNIMQRLYSYKKQMDNLVIMRPKVRALITLIDKNLDKFKDPPRITRNMEAFFRELKGYNRPENWFDRGLNRLYAQAMQTIIMPSPVLSGRNLLQNIAFGHDKSLLIDPRNKSLTDEDLNYFDIYISQLQAMNLDWFMTGEKPLPGLAILTKMVRKIGIYPYSDLANRHWGYWAKINQVKRAFAKDVSLDKKMKATKFSDMELIEQKMALQILAKDGKEAMARYVARVYVDNTQFLYDRSQRSLAEMGRVGRWAGNLMLFPRAYWEMLLKQSRKMTGKYFPVRERLRAFKVLASVIGGGLLVGAAYKKVTGRKENPYDPIVLLAYEPGGLAIGTVEAVTDVYVNILMASKGDDRALAALTTAIPKAADMFIPFYSYATRAFEASTDTKNIDRRALRKIRMLIDNEYKLREGAYILERNAMEKWQYFLSGAGVDVEIKKREAEKKARPVPPYLKKYIEITKPTVSPYLKKYK